MGEKRRVESCLLFVEVKDVRRKNTSAQNKKTIDAEGIAATLAVGIAIIDLSIR